MAALIYQKLGNNASYDNLFNAMFSNSSNGFNPHDEFGFGYLDVNQALQ